MESDGHAEAAQVIDDPWGPEHDSPVRDPVDSRVMVDARGTRLSEQGHPASPKPEKKKSPWIGRIIIGLIVLGLLGAAGYFGYPLVREALDTVSTDDAFVAGHVTNVSPRIEDVVTEVLVDQDDRVEAGTILVRLDREPFEVAVAQAKAGLEQAEAQLEQSRAQTRAGLSQARGAWFRRKGQQEQLRRQVASLQAEAATLRARESSRHLAEVDQHRIEALVKKGSATQAELDQRNNTLEVARNNVKEALAAINETRAALGLAPDEKDPLSVPKDLEEQQSSIQTAVSDVANALAVIGVNFDLSHLTPGETFEQIVHMDSSEGLDKAFGHIIEKAPAVMVGVAAVSKARSQLDDANLRLSYTEIRSEIAGYVQDRQVHPGNRVQPGQTLMSIRPDYVWIDANFKETQLKDIRIGMPVDLRVDAYPKAVFKARVAGFSPGTGLSESLLPPENATGNYVKVTQRLPVRIELVEPSPKDTPLFIGLSVVPSVLFKQPAGGPEAGERLHAPGRPAPPDLGGGPAGRRARRDGADPAAAVDRTRP